MANLRELDKRRKSVRNVKKITRTREGDREAIGMTSESTERSDNR